MPEFSTPYSVKKSENTFSESEMIRAIRFAIASEYEAIQIYEEMTENIGNKDAKTIIEEIIEDEKVHVVYFYLSFIISCSYIQLYCITICDFLQLLRILDPKEEEYYKEGYKETLDMLENKK